MSVRTSTSVWTYVVVFAVLLALWGLNYGLSFIHYGRYFSNAIAVAIGLTQVLLVMLFFMHVKYYQHRLFWFFAGAGLFFLGILMVLTMSDYLTRTRPAGVNPKGEPVFLQSAN